MAFSVLRVVALQSRLRLVGIVIPPAAFFGLQGPAGEIFVRGYSFKPEAVYRTLQKRDENEVKTLLYEDFFGKEPISIALGMEPRRDCRGFVEGIMADVLVDNVSTVAVDAESSEIVGALVALITTPDNPKIPYLSPNDDSTRKMRIIFDILEETNTQFDIYRTFNVTCALHHLMGVVKAGHQKRGLLSGMVLHSEWNAKKKGVNVAYGEATGAYSRKSMENAGLAVVKEFKYSDYLKDGKHVLPDTGVHKGCCLVVKRIDNEDEGIK